LGKGNLLIGQSGGPTSVINSSLYGVIDEAGKYDEIDTVIGMLHGMEGALKEDFINLSAQSRETLEGIRLTPGAALGGCRFMIKNTEPEDDTNKKLFSIFERYNIRYLVYIGGNDSMDTADKISELAKKMNYELKVMGVPKTIDNDLVETHHCPGYGSNAKYVITTVMEAGLHNRSMYTSETVSILTTVGRNTGWLPAASILAKRSPEDAPHLIYLPEVPFDAEKFLDDVERTVAKIGGAFIVTGEGLMDKNGEYVNVNQNGVATDAFGHPELGGVGEYLKGLIENRLKLRARVIKPDIAQQAAMHCASLTDLKEAEMAGRAAIDAFSKGKSGYMVSYEVEGSGNDYKCSTGLVELHRIANAERKVPARFINAEGNFVEKEFADYVLPLIQGTVELQTKVGLPNYTKLEKLPVILKP
jgi:ATP-dependent phosphofructokinase / diphosphate-dependent phosphofructokinase